MKNSVVITLFAILLIVMAACNPAEEKADEGKSTEDTQKAEMVSTDSVETETADVDTEETEAAENDVVEAEEATAETETVKEKEGGLPISFTSIEDLEKQYNWIDAEGGMKYLDVKVGSGREVKENDRIKAFYTVWLSDGKPFSSNKYMLEGMSPADIKSFETSLSYGSLIDGWIKLVQGMKDGGVRRLIIPSEYAYGPDDNRGIPGGSTLVFEMEIVKSTPAR